jgi:hypothetical protein
MVVTLGTLLGTSFVGGGRVQVWMVMVAAGFVAVTRDIMVDYVRFRKGHRTTTTTTPRALNVDGVKDDKETEDVANGGPDVSSTSAPNSHAGHDDSSATQTAAEPGSLAAHSRYPPPWPPSPAGMEDEEPPTTTSIHDGSTRGTRITLPSIVRRIQHRFPSTTTTISRLPIHLLPFAICMFILVRALATLGWIRVFATWLAAIATTPARTAFFVGFICAIVLCPIFGTNIGATS